MDNAAKALLIAGGVFLAILIMALLMYMWSTAGSLSAEAQEAKKLEQITAFNKQYEAYQRKALRGNDVASVINKVRNNNKKYPESPIVWKFKLKKEIIDVLEVGEYKDNSNGKCSAYDQMTNNKAEFSEFKKLYFECTKITYNSKTGKVNSIEFTQITYDEIETFFNTVT